MEVEMKMVFQQKVQEKENKLKQSEEELYARHREMKEALEKQRLELEDKKRRLESGRPLTPEKNVSRSVADCTSRVLTGFFVSRPRRKASSEREEMDTECSHGIRLPGRPPIAITRRLDIGNFVFALRALELPCKSNSHLSNSFPTDSSLTTSVFILSLPIPVIIPLRHTHYFLRFYFLFRVHAGFLSRSGLI